jgi:hypothetical protein
LQAWLDGTYIRPDGQTPADLKIGENIILRATDEPDYWWDGDQALELETKIDLSDYYDKEEIDSMLGEKQDTLTFDTTPTEDSTNPVTS